VQRRGIDFADVLDHRSRYGKLPQYHMVVEGESRLLTAQQRDELLGAGDLLVQDSTVSTNGNGSASNGAGASNGNGAANGAGNGAGNGSHLSRVQKHVELHELKDGEKIFSQLKEFGLEIGDYYLTQEESVSGEKLPTRYALVNDAKTLEIAGVAEILPAIHGLAKQGMEIKRFKGLGEMNSEELWITTLDPARRILLRVTLQDAGDAERMFSVLMGEDVERRRQFIEEHALEVKNLDV
jgi:DNA gyrase subunit B